MCTHPPEGAPQTCWRFSSPCASAVLKLTEISIRCVALLGWFGNWFYKVHMGTHRKLPGSWLSQEQRCSQERHPEGGGYLQDCAEVQEASRGGAVGNTVPAGGSVLLSSSHHQPLVSAASPARSLCPQPTRGLGNSGSTTISAHRSDAVSRSLHSQHHCGTGAMKTERN